VDGCAACESISKPNYFNSESININPKLTDLLSCIYEFKGSKTIIIPRVVNIITEIYKPKTLVTKEILISKDGVYHRGGRDIIAKVLNDTFASIVDDSANIIYDKKVKSEIFRSIEDGSITDTLDFDKDKHIVNMRNGLYNWYTGELSTPVKKCTDPAE